MAARILIVMSFAVFVKNSMAITEENLANLRSEFDQYRAECRKEHPISDEDAQSFKDRVFPDGENAPCYSACVFKKFGAIDDEGKFTYEQVLEDAKKVFEKEKTLTDFEELLKSCDKVNDEEVSDGEHGCDRSKLIFECLINGAKKYDFYVYL